MKYSDDIVGGAATGGKGAKSSGAVSGGGSKTALGTGLTDITFNKIFTNSTGNVDNYTSPIRGMDEALADFNALNPTNVRTAPNGAILGDLPNGTTINIHPGTSVGGAPTLQVPDLTTGKSIKIRY